MQFFGFRCWSSRVCCSRSRLPRWPVFHFMSFATTNSPTPPNSPLEALCRRRASPRGILKKSSFIPVVLLVTLGIIWAAWFFYTSRHESNHLAEISWRVGGDRFTGVFAVTDAASRPVTGAEVHGWNSSGYSSGTTDSQGLVRIEFGEPELYAIDIGHVRVLNRERTYAPKLSVVKGLHVEIKLKYRGPRSAQVDSPNESGKDK
jgi:hypothetical protein